MSCSGSDCTCGCCAGTSVQTPQAVTNPPGLSAVNYRVGTWSAFKESMLARLSSSDYPALAALKTRSDDDFTIAFVDATSVVLDILSFYQERLANESYLRTATQLRSLTELSRLIGYEPMPGVSASAYLAFTLKATPGQAPNPSAPTITIPAGTRAQSVPAQGQTAQTFETSADIPAKADWNALPVMAGQPWVAPGSGGVWLNGTSTQLQRGDYLLVLGVDREQWNGKDTTKLLPSWPAGVPQTYHYTYYGFYSFNRQEYGRVPDTPVELIREQWKLAVVETVQVDTARKLTYVTWASFVEHSNPNPPLGDAAFDIWTTAKVFALRQRAALFGHNAPNPNQFVDQALTTAATVSAAGAAVPAKIVTSLPTLIDTSVTPWVWAPSASGLPAQSNIDLDAVYSRFSPGSWLVTLEHGLAQLYEIKAAATISRADFATSARVTELTLDDANASFNAVTHLQTTEVIGQSEELEVAEQPLLYPLYGTVVDLDGVRPDLVGVTAIALTGNSQKIAVATGVTLSFIPDESTASLTLNPGDVLTVTDPSNLPLNADGSVTDWSGYSASLSLRVQDPAGRPGTVFAALNQFTLVDADPKDPLVREFALVSSITTSLSPYPHTSIQLTGNLQNCYNRFATAVNANVALATHGVSVSEIVGSGNASLTNQNFTLKQKPLTFVQAPTTTGSKSTLQLRVNGALWNEVETLYGQGPTQPVYATLNQEDGTADILFGDGIEGSVIPSGQNNVQASYRIGSGVAGNVAAGAITTLMDRPLGVSGVLNPSAATGGQDAQSVDSVRQNAPQTVLTLGRIVSLADYQNFAATYAGIAKAYAVWIPSGPGRGVFLTVAAAGGAALAAASPTLTNLVASLRTYGSPLVPITVVSFVETLFFFTARIHCDPAFVPANVQAAVLTALTKAFGFDARTFGQGVGVDEITAVIQAVQGVVAATVSGLMRGASSTGGDRARLGVGLSVLGLNRWLSGRIIPVRLLADTDLRLCASLPLAGGASLPQPAEILVIDPAQVTLGVMA